MLKLLSISITLLTISCGVLIDQNSDGTDCQSSAPFNADKILGTVKVYQAGGQELSGTYSRLMKEKYSVKIVQTNLFGLESDMNCYNKFSIPYIKDKFGDSVFEETRILANQMDRDGLGDRVATINTEASIITNYFYERVDPELYKQYLNEDQSDKLVIYSYLEVDAAGKTYDLTEFSVNGQPLSIRLKEVAATLPYIANPALVAGEPVNGKIGIFLYFDKNSIAIYENFEGE